MADINGFDPVTGAKISVPQEAAAEAFRAKKLTFKKGERIPVVVRGVEGTLPAENLDAALEAGETELNFDPHGAAKAAAAGGLRGATLGASDWVAIEGQKLVDPDGAEKTRQALDALRKEHGIASTVGEIGGSLLPSLIPGGGEAALARVGSSGAREAAVVSRTLGEAGEAATATGALNEGAATLKALTDAKAAEGATKGSLLARTLRAADPYRYVGRAGEAVGSAVGEALGPTAGRLASPVARFATEGAVLGAANAVDEAELGDTNLTGETFMANVEHGALWGSALGLVGTGAARILTGAGRTADRLAEAHLGSTPSEMRQALRRHGAGVLGNRWLEEGGSPFMDAEARYELAHSMVERDGEHLDRIVKDFDKNFEGVSALEVLDAALKNTDGALQQYAIAGGNPQHMRDILEKEIKRGLGLQDLPEALPPVATSAVEDMYKKAWEERGLPDPESIKRPRYPSKEAVAQRANQLIAEGNLARPVTPEDVARKVQELIAEARGPVRRTPPVDQDLLARDLNRLARREYREIPIKEVAHNREIWSPQKIADARQRLARGDRMPPARLALADDGKWFVEDGIHRLNAAEEAGFTHIPALVEKGAAKEAPQLGNILNDPNAIRKSLEEERKAAIAAAYEQAKTELKAQHAQARQEFDRTREAHDKLHDEIAKHLTSERGTLEAERSRKAEAIKKFNDELKVGFGQIRGIRKRIDAAIPWKYAFNGDAVTNAAAELKLAARSALEAKVEEKLDGAASAMKDEAALGRYVHAKERYAQAKDIEKFAERGRAREANLFGRPSRVGGISAHAALGMAELVSGHPLAGVMFGIGGGVVRHYGPQVAAWALHKASRLARLKAVRQEVQIANRRNVRSAMGQSASKGEHAQVKLQDLPPHEARQTAVDAMAQVVKLSRDPAGLKSRLAAIDPSLPITAPKTFQAAEGTFRRQVSWLIQQIPGPLLQKMQAGESLNPKDLTDSQARDFLEHAETAIDPRNATDALASGKLTQNQSAAHKAVWPSTHQAAMLQYRRMRAMDKDRFDYLPGHRRSQLESFFESNDPNFVLNLQLSAANAIAAQSQGPPQGKQPKTGMTHAAATSKGMGASVALLSTQSQSAESGPPGRRGRSGRGVQDGL